MSNHTEELVFKQLQDLKSLEIELQTKWKKLKRAGKHARTSFVSSVRELDTRAQLLEHLLDSPNQRAT
jgi:hypothetical protein